MNPVKGQNATTAKGRLEWLRDLLARWDDERATYKRLAAAIGLPESTIKNWASPKRNSIPKTHVGGMVAALATEGIYVTREWLLWGTGVEPHKVAVKGSTVPQEQRSTAVRPSLPLGPTKATGHQKRLDRSRAAKKRKDAEAGEG